MVMPQRRERVLPRHIEDEMRDSFLNYSMSVIVQRALPDVRDGLKPVHRRILYAMNELGLGPTRPHKKSANVVGEVLGKYHPHGDTAVYDAMVRMVQEFSLRYPLVDGQGNFGSIDGDNAAAYRYTEARLARIAEELLADLDKDTVYFARTFDDQRDEPVVLPAKLPNLLLNGSSGIAVGMATNIPPHNLREVAAALHELVANPACTADDLLAHVPGPDFPTGGFIIGTEGIEEAYRTGRGRIIMRARVQREAKRGGKEQLVVTQLPYGINKSKVIEQIADLVRQKKLDDVSDLRDESDRDGMRIVIELKRGAKVPPILNHLYKKTYMQATFGAIMLALDRGVPREMPLKAMLEKFLEHRVEVIQRRASYDLEQAKAEAHVTEGLITALDNIDEVITIIRESRGKEQASERLQARFDLSSIQADAILNMRLHRLTELETRELKDRLRELKKLIRELFALLDSPEQQVALFLAELDGLVEKYGDGRRTTIVRGDAELKLEDMVAQEDVVVTVSHEGYIKRIPISLYRRRVTSGKALAGMERYEDDFLEHVFIASTHDVVLVITSNGHAYEIAVLDIPEGGRSSRGRALNQLLGYEAGARIATLLPISAYEEGVDLVFLTKGGIVKRTQLSEFANIRAGGIIAINLKDRDELLDVRSSDGINDVVLATAQGRAIRFPETEIPQVGRTAQGVIGIRMKEDDEVVGMVVVRRDATLACVTANGFVKRTEIGAYRVQGRGGQGTIALSVSERTGPLVGAKEVLADDELMVITAGGQAARLAAGEIPIQGRATQGKQAVRVATGDRVVEVSRVASERGRGRPGAEPGDGAADSREQLELVATAEPDDEE
ncbi:MAG TPA: DNA gyrase subunit A, partial [Longimicrobiales bacterium]|nr:DNA gyrase subunit A [Longimicrobiales bacterium]